MINLRKKNREEAAKTKEKENTTTQSAETSTQAESQPADSTLASPNLSYQSRSPLEQNFYNLMQLIVRYGERPIEVEEEDEKVVYTIGEVIIYTLDGDEIKAPNTVYQTIMDEFKRHFKDSGFKAEQFYKFHQDPKVSAMAIDMIAEQYQFAQPESDLQLGELVTRLLYEIKLTVINLQIEELETGLKDAQAANDWERQMQILAHQPQLLAQRNEICRRLGNRVINV